jgi:hypothetical protein
MRCHVRGSNLYFSLIRPCTGYNSNRLNVIKKCLYIEQQ